MKQLPSLEYLNERFTYNKETGTLTWKTGRRAGKQAGAILNGYRAVQLDDKSYLTHRISYYMGAGVEPEQVDHINGVKDDNRLENLRSVSSRENSLNQKKRSTNTSGVMGVTYHIVKEKWQARLSQVYLGTFSDKVDAIYARYYAEVDAGYHTNHGR